MRRKKSRCPNCRNRSISRERQNIARRNDDELMKIIISPAKKMNVDTDTMEVSGLPVFLERTQQLMEWMKSLSFAEAKKLWACNEKLAELNFERYRMMELRRNLTPALLSYEGIQYQYMAPGVFETGQWEYVQKHLRILSGFYGILKPFDGVTPYRLEMQAKGAPEGYKDLYAFWGSALFEHLLREEEQERTDALIVNLASKEYSRCIESFIKEPVRFVTCVFGEQIDKKVVQKGTMAKMARGEMVRFMAERQIVRAEELKSFDRLGYRFCEELSTDNELIFLKES